MLNGKFLFTLVGIVMAILAICKLDIRPKPVVENWWNGIQFSRTLNTQAGSCGDSLQSMPGNAFFSAPQFQMTSRFASQGQQAAVKYGQRADYDKQGSETENYNPSPRDHRENYADLACGTDSNYGIGYNIQHDENLKTNYKNGNYYDVYNSLPASDEWRSKPCSEGTQSDTCLPVGTMNAMTPDGETVEVPITTRISVTPMKSRLKAQGDMVRGDLVIPPDCNNSKFNVYPNIVTDLQQGYLGVAGGIEAVDKTLLSTMVASGATTLAGLSLNKKNVQKALKGTRQNMLMSPQYNASQGQGGETVSDSIQYGLLN